MNELRPGSPEEAGLHPERIAFARGECAGWVKRGHTPSLAVCVARRGVIALHEAFGVLGPEEDDSPLARDSIFPIASVTKPLTAALVMQLVEDGLLSLNRPVVNYLPELSGPGVEEVLLHHLLTHTSGYPWHTDPPMLLHAAKKLEEGLDLPPCPAWRNPTIHQQLTMFCDAPRTARAGEVMMYSNFNYMLLGELVSRLRGRGLEEVARERLFDPLGMDSSFYVVPEAEAPRVVRRSLDLPFAAPVGAMPGFGSRQHQITPNGGGGVFSTPLDMLRFGQMILNRGRLDGARVLSPAAVAAMTRDQIPGTKARLFDRDFEHASWGYGFAVESPTKWPYFTGSLPPLGALAHPGAGGAMFWIDPHNELTGAYFEVTTKLTERFEHLWNYDLFTNLIASAVED
jgi:CubicO group peptidase (beta-lactamase class C family)